LTLVSLNWFLHLWLQNSFPFRLAIKAFYRRIGGTLFKVRVYTGSEYADTLGGKMSRLICKEMMIGGGNCGVMDLPQMSQPPDNPYN